MIASKQNMKLVRMQRDSRPLTQVLGALVISAFAIGSGFAPLSAQTHKVAAKAETVVRD